MSLRPAVLCNILIHSFLFAPVHLQKELEQGLEETLYGVWVTSDRFKDKYLYSIEIDEFYRFLDEVIKDKVVAKVEDFTSGAIGLWNYHPSKEELDEWTKNHPASQKDMERWREEVEKSYEEEKDEV